MRKPTRLFLFLCFLLLTQNWTTKAQSGSALATLAASMAPGTWAKLTTNGLIPDMIYHNDDGGINYALNGVWDSRNHVGYFWSGEHSSSLICNPTIDQVACADISERFLKYDAATNTWSEVIDAVTGKPHDSTAGDVGGHPYESLVLDPASGDVYKHWTYPGSGQLHRYDHVDHSWHTMAGDPLSMSDLSASAWYPEADGIVLVTNPTGSSGTVGFWTRSTNTWSTLFTGLGFGYYGTVAVYNPVLHTMLIGSGAGPSLAKDRTFYILTYDSSSGWSISAPRSIPALNECSDAGPFILENSGSLSLASVDPVSGKYIIIARDNSCNLVMWEYNSATDTWALQTGSHVPPSNIILGAAGTSAPGGKVEVTAVPEHGVLMYLTQTSPTTTQAEVWLYKHGGSLGPSIDPTPPSVPTGLSATAISSSQINLSWSASTGSVAGYKVYRGTSLIGTTGSSSYADTGLSASTTYSYAVASYSPSAITSALSASVSATTKAASSPPSGTPPSVPTSVRNTGKSAVSAELTWTASSAAATFTLAGYKIYQNGSLVGTSTYPIYNATGLAPNTSYAFRISAYDTASNESAQSTAVTVTTDSQLFTFAQKCALAGVQSCFDFDSQSALLYKWPDPNFTDSDYYAGDVCNRTLGPGGLGYTNYHDSGLTAPTPQTATFANTEATYINGECVYPFIDTTNKHSGSGSIKFRVPNHSSSTVGEFYGVVKKFSDGTMGYIGPATSTPHADAHHLGDELWVQVYIRADANLLSTAYQKQLYSGFFQTASAGSTTVTLANCPGTQAPVDTNGSPIGHVIWFYGKNTNFTEGAYTVTGITADHCGVIVDHSPTPSGPGGTYPHYAQGFIGNGGNGDGWKNFGMFGERPNSTCCGPASQIVINNLDTGAPSMYSYGISTQTYFTPNMQSRPGCVFTSYPDVAGTVYTEPPCIRYHANQWQEFTIHINAGAGTFTPGACPSTTTAQYQMWIDGQLVQDHNDFVLCWGGTTGTGWAANGFGQFNLSPYHTRKDMTQDTPEGALWFDDLIISTQPIPMLSAVGPSTSGPPTVSVIAPASSTTVSGPSVAVSASAFSSVGIAGVQFKLDGVNLGPETTSVPYSITWDTTLTSNGPHTLTAVARDTASVQTTSAPITVTVNNVSGPTAPPTVSITAPSPSATISGSVTVSASASSSIGVAFVQFKLDGVSLGSIRTTTPYSLTWDTTSASNGSHTLTAVAQDTAGISTTSSAVAVVVNNVTGPTAPASSLLLGYWKFDEGSGTTTADSSGQNNTGNLVNGPGWMPGKFGNALSFNGTNQYVNVGSGVTRVTKNFTITGWLNRSADFPSGTFRMWFSEGVDGDGGWAAYVQSNGTTHEHRFLKGGRSIVSSAIPNTKGTWEHVAWVVDTSTQPSLYINGNLVFTASDTLPIDPPGTAEAYIGADQSPARTASSFFPGGLDDIRLYNRALSASEVASVYAGADIATSIGPTPDTVPPTVAIAAPSSGSTVSGNAVTVSANASDNVGVVGVQFKLDGTNLGAAKTTVPFAITWDTTQVSNGAHTLTALAWDLAGNQTTSAPVTVTVSNTSPITVSISAPTSGATVSGTSVTVSATGSSAVGVAGVQFKLDGANLGFERTAAPYTITWDTTQVANGSHTLTAVARDTSGIQATSAGVIVTVSNTSSISVSITTPVNGATVSGTSVTISANASNTSGIGGVQFKLDGADLGAEKTAAPYTITWDTTGATNGSHTLTAVARDTVGNHATSAPVAVIVSNVSTLVISITSPVSGSIVSGPVTVTASGTPGIASVQFKLDGGNLGPLLTAAPFSVVWDTALATSGNHTLVAVALDSTADSATSAPVVVTVSLSSSISITGPAVRYSLSSQEAKLWTGTGFSAPMAVGYAQIQTDSGRNDLGGVAVFSARSNGVLVSQASVPVSPLLQSGTIYVDIDGPENTGIAFANPNSVPVTISFSFNDALGNSVGSGSFSLGARRQFSAFLSQAPFNAPTKIEGTFSFTSSQSISAVALRGLTNERSDFLMTTLPVVSVSDGSPSAAIPHFAVGGGWSTRLVLVNPTNDLLNGRVDFMSPGTPNSSASLLTLTVNDVRATGFNYSIPPRGVTRVTLKSTLDGSLKVGSMKISSSNNTAVPSGFAIFSFNTGGVTVSEASVPIDKLASALRLYAESSGNLGAPGSFQTGVAIVNPSPSPTSVTLELTQSDGSATGLRGSFTIPAGGQVARFVNELIPNLPDAFRGLLRVSATSPISAIGLRFTFNERGDYLMTTMPTASETVDVSGGQEFFPHIVEGGGYTTQVVIFNRASGASISGNLVFTASDGSPLTWQ